MIRRTLLFLLVAGLTLGASVGSVAFAGSNDDEDIAEASVLTEDDVADYGLEEEKPVEDGLPPNVPACKKIRALDKASDRLPSAESQFSDGDGTTAFNKVLIFSSARAARASIAAFASDNGGDCVAANLDRALSDAFEEYEFDGESIDVDLGDNSIVYQIIATVTDEDGDSGEIYIEVGLIQVDNGLIQLAFQAVDAPFDGSEDLATLVTDNLESNLGG
jgi:hypothetical protein